jgi:hypothetical protein
VLPPGSTSDHQNCRTIRLDSACQFKFPDIAQSKCRRLMLIAASPVSRRF